MPSLVALLLLWTSTNDDATTLIDRVIAAQQRQQTAQRMYAYRETTVTRHLEDNGEISKTEGETFLVTPTTGGEYRRLVAKDDQALSPTEEAEEQKKLEEHVAKQLRMSADERERKTREKLEERVERYQTRLEEAMEVFDFEALPDEIVDGARLRVFRFSKKSGYEGHSRPTKIFARMAGVVWIDPARDQLAKVEVEFTEDLKFLGGVFGRVSKGTRATVEGELRDDMWMLDRADVLLNARLYFFKRYRRHITVHYDDYRKYEVETHEQLRKTAATMSER